MNMQIASEVINKQTGLRLQVSDSVTLRNGRKAERAYVNLGDAKLSVLLIEVNESFGITREIKDLIQLAEYERIIIHTSHLLPEQMKELKEKKIGYIDDHEHYYIPLEIVSSESFHSDKKKRMVRSSSSLNEFALGFLFFKNYGLLDQSQAETGALFGKSAATVNLTLRSMETANLIVKSELGYHLANLENYFERWRFIMSQYKASKEFGRFNSKISDAQLKELQFKKIPENKWALSGPKIESLLEDGYLNNAAELTIYFDIHTSVSLMQSLKLIPDNSGSITLYPSALDLRDKGQFAHEIFISAELMNSNNPRVKEAGERRFEKYLKVGKKVVNERFGGTSFQDI